MVIGKDSIIIEELINVNYSAPGAFPNIEFKIHKERKDRDAFITV